MKKILLLVLMPVLISACSKDDEKVRTEDDFYPMTGSYTLSKIITNSSVTNFEYQNSKLYKATFIDTNTNTVTGYRNYEFNEDGLIEYIYELSSTNKLITKYQYIYNSDLLLSIAYTYNNTTGHLVLESIRMPIYDSNDQLVKLNYMNATSQLQQYQLFYYNSNGDFRKTETYDKNDNLISYYECEWDDNPNIYSKMYRLPWMDLHNRISYTDSYGYSYEYVNFYNDDYPIKIIIKNNGTIIETNNYIYN